MIRYTPTEILPGDTGLLREHSFTAWLQLEHLQAATDFALSIGLLPIYAEHQNRDTGRYLFWSPPLEWSLKCVLGALKPSSGRMTRWPRPKACNCCRFTCPQTTSIRRFGSAPTTLRSPLPFFIITD